MTTVSTTVVPPRSARLAVATVFFLNGAGQGNWVARIPAIQDRLGIGEGALGTALLGLPLGLVVGAPLAGWLIARAGGRAVTRLSLLAYCVALPLPALAPDPWLLMSALLALGVAAGSLDVAMNTVGVAVEARYERPIISSFHGMFSLGGLAGAATGGAAASQGISPAAHVSAAATALLLVGLLASRWLLPATTRPRTRGPRFVLPDARLLGLGIIAFCVLLGEGAIGDWSALYLREVAGASAGLAAGGFAAFSLTMAAGRFAGDAITRRLGPTGLVRLGGALAAGGMLLALLVPRPLVAIAALGCVGLGLSALFPVALSAAGRSTTLPSGSAIAAVTTLGYLGLLAGPPLIGFAAERAGLRNALGLVALLGALVVALGGAAGREAGDG